MRFIDIADVSHFVHSDNAMDTEAAARGTTVYLVDNRIDMLPSLLGTNLCSLRPFVERLAFSLIWVCYCSFEFQHSYNIHYRNLLQMLTSLVYASQNRSSNPMPHSRMRKLRSGRMTRMSAQHCTHTHTFDDLFSVTLQTS